MAQYEPMYDSFRRRASERYVPSARMSVSSSVYLPGSEVDLYTGQLKPDHQRRCRVQGKRLEEERLERERRKLEAALRRRRAPCMVGTGSMTAPCLPLEAELRLTRRAMEGVERYGCGFTVITKSDLILRDLDLLSRIQQNAKCVVQMTLTTADETLCR